MKRLGILALVIGGGAAALSWELLWQLHITLALGVSAFGTAVTLAATMAGMTLGSLAMGRWLAHRSIARPMRLYGWLELAIGISGLLMRPGFALVERLDAWLYALSPAFAPAFQIAGIALLLGPPTLAMGASVPVFARVAQVHQTSIAVLYGLNTAGAALGVLLLSFVVLPRFGVFRTGLLVAALNATVFVAAQRYGSAQTTRTQPRPAAARPLTDPQLTPLLASWLVFGTGFVTFGLEIAWFRSLRAAFQTTTVSFAIVLASVLVPLAVGAQLVPWLRQRGVALGTALAFAGAAILLSTPLVERMDLFATFYVSSIGRLTQWALLSGLVMGPSILWLGTVLPWCLEEFARPVQACRLYAINAIGSVSGSLLAAWMLLPSFGFARTAWLQGALVVGLALLASRRRARVAVAAAGAAALFVAVTWSSSVGRDRIQVNDAGRTDHEIVAHHEGPDVTVSVVTDREGHHMLVVDGFVTASDRKNASYMEWMGRLPMLLHNDPRKALVVCFGTGQTAHAVRDESPQQLDVVDLNRVVFDLAPHFDSNERVLQDPRVRSLVMDGRAWIRRNETHYDIVTLEPMPPHFAGMNALYSIEFYERVAAKLAPDGVVAQWLPIHLLPTQFAASIVATFQAVFPDAALWLDPTSRTGILLGRLSPGERSIGADWPGLERGHQSRSLSNHEIRAALSLGPRGVARFGEGAEIITDDNQLLADPLMVSMLLDLTGRPLVQQNLRRVDESRVR